MLCITERRQLLNSNYYFNYLVACCVHRARDSDLGVRVKVRFSNPTGRRGCMAICKRHTQIAIHSISIVPVRLSLERHNIFFCQVPAV